MDYNFTIKFGKSLSSEYETALEYASMFEKFTPIGPASKFNTIDTSNHEAFEKFQLFQKLIESIKDLDSSIISDQKKEIDFGCFYLNIKDISECYFGCLNAKNQIEYCNDETINCWGCKKLTGIVLHHSESPFNKHAKYWYQYGVYTNKSTWSINKEDISQALNDIVGIKNIDFCPVFQYVFFRKLVAALPAYIDASDTKNWGPVFLDDSISNSKLWEPVSIYHKTSSTTNDKMGKEQITVNDSGSITSKNFKSLKESEFKNLRNIPDTSFADIGGIDEIINNIRTVIELPIKKPEIYNYLKIKPYRGILLWGEPGNGKTLIAKAIAHEVNAHFIPIGGPDFFNKDFGASEKNLRDIFIEARELQPSVVFFDEIDSIAQTRLAGETSKWYSTVVNQLMTLMDGIEEFGNVTVLASTNRPDLLDSALLRPGRFDFKLEVKRPNLPACKKVLEIATRGMPLADDVNLFTFAESVVGYSGAEIAFIAKEAAMSAIRRTIDIKAVINDDDTDFDYSKLVVNKTDFYSALHAIKWNTKYVNKTYSLKG